MTRQASILIKNGILVTMDGEDFPRGDVLIENDRISAVAAQIPAPAGAEKIDAAGMIVMPGLVNAHQHTWQTAIRGIAGDWTLFDYGRNMHAGFAKRSTRSRRLASAPCSGTAPRSRSSARAVCRSTTICTPRTR
jgi:cytosine/adenosine deaminase-related metal-dependent hydrolase